MDSSPHEHLVIQLTSDINFVEVLFEAFGLLKLVFNFGFKLIDYVIYISIVFHCDLFKN